MLFEETAFFAMLGLMTSVILWLITTEGKKYFFILSLVGLTTGWLSGIFWIYLTGGLTITIYSMLIPVLFSLVVSAIILFYLPEPHISKPVSDRLFNLSIVILIGTALLIAYSAIPISSLSVASNENFDVQANPIRTLELNSADLQSFHLSQQTNQIPISMDYATSSVKLFSDSESPYEDSYLHFRITFSVSSNDWVKPYIKIGVFKDNNCNGYIDSGDELWTNTNYKVILNTGNWRANVQYVNGQPAGEIFAVQKPKLLPIFYASQITQWKDDTQFTFPNTPKTYKPPVDMLSWDGNTLKETVSSYAIINSGSTASIEGMIYCPVQSVGKYLILVQTFDARYSQPYEDSTPISQKTIPFEVKGGEPNVSIDWTMAVVLTAVSVPSIVGAVLYRKW